LDFTLIPIVARFKESSTIRCERGECPQTDPPKPRKTAMSRLSIPTVDNAPEASKPLFAAVNKQLGVVPNLMKLVGHSPAALEGYLSLNGALAKGKLNVKLRESIALAVAEYNGCDYCLSAHDYLGRNVAKLNDSDIDAARDGHATDARTDAALRFARRVAESRGRVSDTEIAALRNAGFDEASVIEIVVNVALNVLTNYVNNVAQTDIDFPKVSAKLAA
jgi:uncharacterized peroxidase-related enzyme